MAGGGLFDPLGTDRPQRGARAGPSLWLIALSVVLIGLAGLFAAAAFRNGGEGGEPRAVAEIGPVRHIDPLPPASPSLVSAAGTLRPSGLPGGSIPASDQEVQIENGVRVIRPRRDGATGGSLVVKVPESMPLAAAQAPVADDRLLEPGASGPLPRIASDGRRPAEVYAGAAVPGSTGKPWISIVIRGSGIDPGGAAETPADWPPGVTLGFAVDAADLAQQVGRARAAGHEVVLMIPPRKGGAQEIAVTSAGGASATSARDRLRWQLSRFTGYAGVVVDSTNQDVATVAADVLDMTRRGLYVVDATPPRAAAPTSGVQAPVLPVTMADVVLTGSAEGETPERFLDRLVTLARSTGSAIGIAPASPRSFAAISRFAATLADRGVALVPLGTVVSLRQSAQARPLPVPAP